MEKYFSEKVLRLRVGKGEDGMSAGTKDSSGPLEGVVAVKTPEGVAVKNVPLLIIQSVEGRTWR